MTDLGEELVPPDDPRFEGAQFISNEARIAWAAENSGELRGATWHWAVWRETSTVSYNAKTGTETEAVWDHDHCHFCYQNAFSERYDDDLREGWTTDGPAGAPQEEQRPNYHWVCPECFERFRATFDWSVAPPSERGGGASSS